MRSLRSMPAAIIVVASFSLLGLSAAMAQNPEPAPAACPAGHHWLPPGYYKGTYRQGRCVANAAAAQLPTVSCPAGYRWLAPHYDRGKTYQPGVCIANVVAAPPVPEVQCPAGSHWVPAHYEKWSTYVLGRCIAD
jgi:hypothetical protein